MLKGSDIEQILRAQSPRWDVLTAALAPMLDHINRLEGVQSHESGAVSFTLPKTSALIFDRVWERLDSRMPSEIAFWTGTVEEAAYVATFGNAILRQQPDVAWGYQDVFGGVGVNVDDSKTLESVPQYTRQLVSAIAQRSEVSIIPVYNAAVVRDDEFRKGDRAALVASIDGLNIISEEDLSWEQVLEIRHDRATVRKLRRLMHWLERDMVGRDLAFIQDEIAIRIDDYQSSLAKYGLRTIGGCIASTLDSKVVIGGTAAVAGLSYALEPSWALLAGAAIVVGRAAVHIAERLLDFKELKESSEVAFLVELSKKQ